MFWSREDKIHLFGNRVMFFLLYGRRTSFYNFLKFSENFRKSSEVFGNLRTFSENFGNGSKVIFRWFYDFLKFSENLRKSLEVFGNLRKCSENFGKRFKSNFQMFLWFFKIFGKSSEIVGSVRKTSIIFRKLRKRFKRRSSNGSNFRSFNDVLKFSENLWKCSEIWRYFH